MTRMWRCMTIGLLLAVLFAGTVRAADPDSSERV